MGIKNPKSPNMITTSTTRKPQKPLEGMAITFDGTPDEEIKNNFEKLVQSCVHSRRDSKTSPSLIFYCIFIANPLVISNYNTVFGLYSTIIDRIRAVQMDSQQ